MADRLTLWQRKLLMAPARVAREAVDALLRGKATSVPGRLNALGASLTHLVPRSAAAAIAARLVDR